MKQVCVFCGSRSGRDPIYREAAIEMGTALARRGLTLIYGGGNVGLMGAVADASLAAGGQVIGVIPRFLSAREVAHSSLTELHIVDFMHERKARMADLADSFVALPGGYGTLEEFCEILTWAQLHLHHKPIGLLNISGYYTPLLNLFDHAVAEEFVSPALRSLVLEATDPSDMLDLLAQNSDLGSEGLRDSLI